MKNISPLILMAFIAVSLTASVMEPALDEDFDNYISREFEPMMHIYDEEKVPIDQENENWNAALSQVDVKMIDEEPLEIPKELIDLANNLSKPVNGSDFEDIVNEYGPELKKLRDNFVHITNTSVASGTYTDCQQYYDAGKRNSGIYLIHPDRSLASFNVSCDFSTDPGHGWTSIMRRGSSGSTGTGEIFFYQNWNAYRNGFGGLGADHWLGLSYIKYLTNQRPSILRVDLYDCDGQHRFAEYDYFALGNSETNYELLLGLYTAGDAGDALSFHRYKPFSTFDRDNDGFSGNCASLYKAGWWFNDCYESSLNGLYYDCTSVPPGHTGITWKTFRGFSYSLERAEMKVRPKD